MPPMSLIKGRGKIMLVVLILLALACNLPGASPAQPQPTAYDPTKAALEFQSTAVSQQMTQQAMITEPPAQPTEVPPTPVPPTAIPPTSEPATVAPAETEAPPAAPDFEERMKTAKILVYEDTPYIGLWIKDTLQGMGLKATFVGDAMGNFMENLNSGIKWDLVIVGAESHDYVSGDFFDVLTKRVVNDDTALILELWYLDEIANGKIKPLTTKCGIELQKSYNLASSIYWLDSSDPVFTEPNIAVPLIHYDIYWQWQAGDYVRLIPGSNAKILAGMFQDRDNDYGVITSCFDGRVIIQTFCNHDYHQSDIQLLYENYIYNTLKNHFAALDE